MKAGTHSAFGERSHTRAHTAKQGHSLPRPQCGFALPVNSFLFRHAFIYIHFPVHCEPSTPAEGKIWQSCCHKFYSPTASHPVFQLLAQMAHVCLHSRKRVHTRLSEKDRTQALTRRNRGRFGWGWYHYSRSVPHVHQHPRAGYQNGKFCRFWGLVKGTLEERRKPSEQRCAYACRCSEASRPHWAA